MLQLVKSIAGIAIFAFLVLMAYLITAHSIKYFSPQLPHPFLEFKRDWFWLYLPALYGHIVSSGLILVLGFVGFSGFIRRRYIHIHRALGKVYVGLVLLVSAPCGLVMAAFAIDRGWLSLLNFLLLSVFWWWFTYQGWQSIRQGNTTAHQRWMWRSYALTLSAVLLRWYSFFFAYYGAWRGETAYIAAAWLSWLPNLLVVEVYFYFKKKD